MTKAERTMDGEAAARQSSAAARFYARNALDDLCRMLGIDRNKADWRVELAPFAPVLAAMIIAAARDFHTATGAGLVEGTLANRQLTD
jgi:hypothetical protein